MNRCFLSGELSTSSRYLAIYKVYNLFYLDLIYFNYTQGGETFTLLYICKIILMLFIFLACLKIKRGLHG
ncbi:hypothetical protein ALTERO38_60877 [Alteromonas sp. 38]|nr:hypothetical protein ALTER154_30057 [Alteromonas sp. 154]VXC36160.1 hypothetical protein ALTERO38_60877 [Alteromonas sp. 38]